MSDRSLDRSLTNGPVTAWAVVDRRGRLALREAQAPLFWNRSVARRYADERDGDGIQRVIITAVDKFPTTRKAQR